MYLTVHNHAQMLQDGAIEVVGHYQIVEGQHPERFQRNSAVSLLPKMSTFIWAFWYLCRRKLVFLVVGCHTQKVWFDFQYLRIIDMTTPPLRPVMWEWKRKETSAFNWVLLLLLNYTCLLCDTDVISVPVVLYLICDVAFPWCRHKHLWETKGGYRENGRRLFEKMLCGSGFHGTKVCCGWPQEFKGE